MSVQNIVSHQIAFPGIDYDVGISNVLGDEDLFKEIILMFYEDHSNDADKIEKAILENDRDNSKHLVHTLKGVACSIGAMDIFETIKLLDIAINESNQAEYQSLFDSFKPEFTKVVEGIEIVLRDEI